jgi:ubiquinone biosynthesis protein UbiJ
MSEISEFRRRALALAKAKNQQELTPYLELIAELARVIDTITDDVRGLKIRLGYLSSQLTGLVGQETEERIAPLALQLEQLVAEVDALKSRVSNLERAVGDPPGPPRSFGGEG